MKLSEKITALHKSLTIAGDKRTFGFNELMITIGRLISFVAEAERLEAREPHPDEEAEASAGKPSTGPVVVDIDDYRASLDRRFHSAAERGIEPGS